MSFKKIFLEAKESKIQDEIEFIRSNKDQIEWYIKKVGIHLFHGSKKLGTTPYSCFDINKEYSEVKREPKDTNRYEHSELVKAIKKEFGEDVPNRDNALFVTKDYNVASFYGSYGKYVYYVIPTERAILAHFEGIEDMTSTIERYGKKHDQDMILKKILDDHPFEILKLNNQTDITRLDESDKSDEFYLRDENTLLFHTTEWLDFQYELGDKIIVSEEFDKMFFKYLDR